MMQALISAASGNNEACKRTAERIASRRVSSDQELMMVMDKNALLAFCPLICFLFYVNNNLFFFTMLTK